MGCACPTDNRPLRDSTGEEEIAVFESALVFSKLPAAKTATEVQVFSHAFWMNGKQIRDLFKALGIDPHCLDEEQSPKSRFFEMFKDRKKYNARKITLLGVLLGAGSAIKKAEIMFGLYRVDEEQCDLSASQVFQLVQDASEVALLALPQYARMELEAMGDSNALPKLTRYVEKVGGNLPSAVHAITSSILSETEVVSEVLFKARVANTEAKVLCCASEMRNLAIRTEAIPMPRGQRRDSRPPERLDSEGSEGRMRGKSANKGKWGWKGTVVGRGSTDKLGRTGDAGGRLDQVKK